MKNWWRQMITLDNPLCPVVNDFASDKVTVIEKSQYDAFMGTSLEHDLEESGIAQLVITGVMTHLCCESTARAAFMRGFNVFFTIDGTATYNRKFHEASLLNLAHGFAFPVLTEYIRSCLSQNTLKNPQ